MSTILTKISCSQRQKAGQIKWNIVEFRNFSAGAYNRLAVDSESRERSRSVTSFYYQSAIDNAAAQVQEGFILSSNNA